MSQADDSIAALAGLTGAYKAQEHALRNSFLTLSERLATVCKECAVYFSGEDCEFELCGFDECTYGHLSCDSDGVNVAYRSPDDVAESAPDGSPLYRVVKVTECPIAWLRALVQSNRVAEFVGGLRQYIETLGATTKNMVTIVDGIANSPSVAVSEDFEHVAKALGFPRAITEWREAQASVTSNAERAISLACVLLETVCKHVLGELGEPLPNDESVTPLFKATSRALGLDPTNQAEPELRGFCGGLATVVQQLGSLRTKYGEAHGKGAAHLPMSTTHARLVVNSAGAVATFVMERWHSERKQPRPESPT